MENFQVFSFGCSKYTLVGGNKRDVFTECLPKADGGGQMNGIETFEGMPPDQIARKEEPPQLRKRDIATSTAQCLESFCLLLVKPVKNDTTVTIYVTTMGMGS